ncbi:MAG: hypothetical protein NXI23_26115 [Bacteroidetes bacterium]|nr:hypothetical protein [Bacteroidota bacterium]
MKNQLLIIILLLSLISACSSPKQIPVVATSFGFASEKALSIPTTDQVSVFESLPEDDLVMMTLTTNLSKVLREKQNPAYQPASLKYVDRSSNEKEWNIKIKPRGNMRRKTCYYPPLKLKFSKKDLRAQGLKEIKTMKVAMKCQSRDSYDQLLIREFVAYKIYNILTDQSFQAKLGKMRIEDSEGKKDPFTSYAILIEHEKEMASRINGRLMESKHTSKGALVHDAYDRMSLFQFMIGNTDWHIYNRHNLKMVHIEGESFLTPVAYDFDYAGLVNAPYAVPKPGRNISDVTERFYQGACRSKEDYEKLLQPFRDKKGEIMDFCENFPHLDNSSRKYILKYLGSFYEIIENPRKTKRFILKHCDKDVAK